MHNPTINDRILRLVNRRNPKPHIFFNRRWWAVGVKDCNYFDKLDAGRFVKELNETEK